MAFRCDICGKGSQVVNKVSHSNRKSKRIQAPNLHNIHAIKDGQRLHLLVCTRCIRSGTIIKAG
jgi:large subunit ribosomal protein L28